MRKPRIAVINCIISLYLLPIFYRNSKVPIIKFSRFAYSLLNGPKCPKLLLLIAFINTSVTQCIM